MEDIFDCFDRELLDDEDYDQMPYSVRLMIDLWSDLRAMKERNFENIDKAEIESWFNKYELYMREVFCIGEKVMGNDPEYAADFVEALFGETE